MHSLFTKGLSWSPTDLRLVKCLYKYRLKKRLNIVSCLYVSERQFKSMKIQTFLFLAPFLLCAAFVQDTEGAFGVLPSGTGRVLAREVCIFGIKDKINILGQCYIRFRLFVIAGLQIRFSIKTSTNILCTCSCNLLANWCWVWFCSLSFVCFPYWSRLKLSC